MRSTVTAAVLLLCCALALCSGKPVQLFKPNAGHTELLPCDEGLAVLAAINKPVAVVSVVGPYRSGKSFLLNQLLGRTSGFELGSTVTPVTMGVWFWDDPPTLNGTALILIDTEGLYSPHVPAAYDAKMFALSLIFSSTLVYNELGVLSQQSIDRFQYLTRLTIKFLDKSTETAPLVTRAANAMVSGRAPAPNELDHPSFFWVLEDFNLDLEPGQTSEQWLLNFLRPTREGDVAAPQTLKLFGQEMSDHKPMFSSVNVQMLSFPHYEPDKMKHLDRVDGKELLPTYQAQMKAFRDKLLSTAKPKQFAKIALGGRELSGLLRVTVAEMNSKDKFPSIVSMWDLYLQLQNSDAETRAMAGYRDALQQALDTQPPLTAGRFNERNGAATRDALALFDREAVPGEDTTHAMRVELQKKLDADYQKHAANHLNAVSNFCTRVKEMRLSQFQREVQEYVQKPRAEPDLIAFLRAKSDEATGSMICGELCPATYCDTLKSALSESSARRVAENKEAIRTACRAARENALALFTIDGERECTPILELRVLQRKLYHLRLRAESQFNATAPVHASERAANEDYVALQERLLAVSARLEATNEQKRAVRLFVGFALPAMVLAVHVLFILFRGAMPRALQKTYTANRVTAYLVCAFGWLFLMFYHDIKHALLTGFVTGAGAGTQTAR